MTRDDIIKRITCAVIAQSYVDRDVKVLDFAPSAFGFLVLCRGACTVSIHLDLNERDELWAKWHEAARESGLTVSGAAG